MKVTLRHFFSGKCWPFTIDAPPVKQFFQTEAFFISIANANQFGNHFTIAPKARLDDGLLDIVIVKKMNKARTLLAVSRQIMGGRPKDIVYFQTPALRIINNELAPLHIDGDPKDTAPEFNIRVLPKIVQLIQP